MGVSALEHGIVDGYRGGTGDTTMLVRLFHGLASLRATMIVREPFDAR